MDDLTDDDWAKLLMGDDGFSGLLYVTMAVGRYRLVAADNTCDSSPDLHEVANLTRTISGADVILYAR